MELIKLQPVIIARTDLPMAVEERLLPSDYPHVHIYTPDEITLLLNLLTANGVKLEVLV